MHLFKQLLIGREGEYLGARDAVREAHRDLLHHQNAFLDAMNSAFIELADRFDPDELAPTYELNLGTPGSSYALDRIEDCRGGLQVHHSQRLDSWINR